MKIKYIFVFFSFQLQTPPSLRRTLHHFVNKFWRNLVFSSSIKCPPVIEFYEALLIFWPVQQLISPCERDATRAFVVWNDAKVGRWTDQTSLSFCESVGHLFKTFVFLPALFLLFVIIICSGGRQVSIVSVGEERRRTNTNIVINSRLNVAARTNNVLQFLFFFLIWNPAVKDGNIWSHFYIFLG